MPQAQRREVLLLFEDAHANYQRAAFGGKKAAAAALNWVVLAFRDEDEWLEHEEVFARLRQRLVRVFRSIEPYCTAVRELGASPEDAHPQAVRAHLEEHHPKDYNAQLNRQNDGLAKFQGWASGKRPDLTPYVTAFVVLAAEVLIGPGAQAAVVSVSLKAIPVVLVLVALSLIGWGILSLGKCGASEDDAPLPLVKQQDTTAHTNNNPPLRTLKNASTVTAANAASVCGSLDHEYRRRECLLTQGQTLAATSLEQALTTFHAGLQVPRWKDTTIPELTDEDWASSAPYIYELQQIRFHKDISSIYYQQGRFKESRDEFRIAFEMRRALPQARFWDQLNANECFTMMALERRHADLQSAVRARDECVIEYPGRSCLPYGYEEGFVRLAAGKDQRAAEAFAYQIFLSYACLGKEDPLEKWPGLVVDTGTVITESTRHLNAAIGRLIQEGRALRLQDAWAFVSNGAILIMPFPVRSAELPICQTAKMDEWRVAISSQSTHNMIGMPFMVGGSESRIPTRIEAELLGSSPCWPSSLRHTLCVVSGVLKADDDCARIEPTP